MTSIMLWVGRVTTIFTLSVILLGSGCDRCNCSDFYSETESPPMMKEQDWPNLKSMNLSKYPLMSSLSDLSQRFSIPVDSIEDMNGQIVQYSFDFNGDLIGYVKGESGELFLSSTTLNSQGTYFVLDGLEISMNTKPDDFLMKDCNSLCLIRQSYDDGNKDKLVLKIIKPSSSMYLFFDKDKLRSVLMRG